LGVGDARYRCGGRAGNVDTVPFGAFRRSLIDRIGMFDETLLSNEDYEFNARIRKSGGVVWLDPMIRCTYFARGKLSELARQYWRYGFWKMRMLKRYPSTLRWRQALPPVFVLGVLLTGLIGIWLPVIHLLLAVGLMPYAALLVLAGGKESWSRRDPALVFGVPLAISTMHFSWGGAFLWSLIQDLLHGGSKTRIR
jgi:succinoglycan biosynthesis protein ExoA